MSAGLVTVLVLLVLLQIKHLFADFFMQTPKMLTGRSTYIHMGRAQHAAIHSAGSVLVFLIFGAPLPFIAIVVLLEWVVHFHIDWCKAAYSEMKGHTPQMPAFWHAMGVDQALHHLTYVAMTAAWVLFGTPAAG